MWFAKCGLGGVIRKWFHTEVVQLLEIPLKIVVGEIYHIMGEFCQIYCLISRRKQGAFESMDLPTPSPKHIIPNHLFYFFAFGKKVVDDKNIDLSQSYRWSKINAHL